MLREGRPRSASARSSASASFSPIGAGSTDASTAAAWMLSGTAARTSDSTLSWPSSSSMAAWSAAVVPTWRSTKPVAARSDQSPNTDPCTSLIRR
jgi:hypothetical protein